MRPSIRTFLLINLLLSVTLIISLAIIGNLFLAHKDIQIQLDSQLVRTAARMQSLFSDFPRRHEFHTIQSHLTQQTHLLPLQKDIKIKNQADEDNNSAIEFQIWNHQGKLILHSSQAPPIPFSDGKKGFSTLWINDIAWRVYTSYNRSNRLSIMVAERQNYRQHLENQLTQDSVIIMLITYPFLGLLIWIIVGRGLDAIKRVAEEVKHRAPTFLKHVNVKSVPSEIQPLLEELNSLFDRLHYAFEQNKRFTADAAHELKTPLAALSAQTQVALRSKTPEEQRGALLKVLSGVNRSTHVVQQLLTLSRMDPEAQINEPQVLDLNRLVAEVATMLAPEAIAKNINLELYRPESPCKILGNETSLNILFRNIVDNAIRYTDSGGKVVIDLTLSRKFITLKVIDNGPGIPEELRKQVFERFFRVIGNKTTGSGLGLSIVKRIVNHHNAKIKLLSPPDGKGLEFQVIFKRYRQQDSLFKR